MSLFSKAQAQLAAEFDQNQINSASIKRQLNKILDVGIAGYNDTDTLRKVRFLVSNFSSFHNNLIYSCL